MIADAGYAHRGPLGRIAERGAHFIVRVAWSTLPPENEAGEAIDLLATIASLSEAEPGEFAVFFRTPDGGRVAARLVAIRKSEPAAAQARRRIRQQAGKRHDRSIFERCFPDAIDHLLLVAIEAVDGFELRTELGVGTALVLVDDQQSALTRNTIAIRVGRASRPLQARPGCGIKCLRLRHQVPTARPPIVRVHQSR